MDNKKIDVLDSTLRDGLQNVGISLSKHDKLSIIKELDKLGVDFIEIGNPFCNSSDVNFLNEASKLELTHSKLVTFCSTRKKDKSAFSDEGLNAIKNCNIDYISIFGKCSSFQVKEVLSTTKTENLHMIEESISFLKSLGKTVFFDAEHYFDGFKEDSEYCFEVLNTAIKSGASLIVLCDTNGSSFVEEIDEIVKKTLTRFPNEKFGIHCHNDMNLAVANTICAISDGCLHLQGTLIGIGERCGNTNLCSVIPSLQLKRHYSLLPDDKIKHITNVAKKVSDILNITMNPSEPYVGTHAFIHKAGMHADGILKNNSSFEHINPESIGNERQLILSSLSGKSIVYNKLLQFFGNSVTEEDAEIILKKLKEYEEEGFQFDYAEASFYLMALKTLNRFTESFQLINYKCISELPAIEGNIATAILKIKVNGKTSISASEGDGPVHALDLALRKALKKFYPAIADVSLRDYKVRVLDSNATASKVRVLATSSDGVKNWTTVGVSNDIIEASWLALVESFEYKIKTSLT